MPIRPASSVLALVVAACLLVTTFHLGRASAAAGSDRRRTAVVKAVEHASPAVVNVHAFLRRRGARGSGAGVLVHPDGYVVTNAHVIDDAYRVGVQLFGQRTTLDAQVVLNDPAGDLALLKIRGGGPWPYVSLARAGDVLLGETAIAIGNPRGLGDTITVGIVSAVGRSAKLANGATLRGLVQTDASINSGNSGGPLLNLDGELIGINASLLPSATGIAFAISSDHVAAMLGRALGNVAPPRNLVPPATAAPAPTPAAVPPPRVLEAPPLAAAPRRGTDGPAASSRLERAPEPVGAPPAAAGEALPPIEPLRPSDLGVEVVDDGRRLLVDRVPAGTPAARAGLLPGDVLLEIDGLAVGDETDLVLAFVASFPGRRYTLTVRRGADARHLLLTVPE